MANRIQIPFSFNYPSGGNLVPAANVSVGVYTRNNDGSQGAPAPVFQAQSGTAQYSSMQTDAGGNVPGWVNEGTYKIVAAASGGFGGGTINFDALYGGGTAQIGVSAVGPSQLQANAVGTPALTTAVAQALVPAGVILDYAGATPPSGFLSCNGGVVGQSTYPALYTAIGNTWNIGGEGAGNFRLPNATNRFLIGTGGTLILGGSGGTLGHTHTAGSLEYSVSVNTSTGSEWVTGTIPALTVAAHAHSLGSGWANICYSSYFNNTSIVTAGRGSFFPGSLVYDSHAWSFTTSSLGGPYTGVSLGGTTDYDGGSTNALGFGTGWMTTSGGTYAGSGSTNNPTGATSAADPPYIVVNKIIKT